MPRCADAHAADVVAATAADSDDDDKDDDAAATVQMISVVSAHTGKSPLLL